MDTVRELAMARRQRVETGMPSGKPRRLYDLLDSLVALRLEFADGAEGEGALAALGRAKVMEVRTMLDTAIRSAKRIIGEVERPASK